MKFEPLIYNQDESVSLDELKQEYKEGRQIGKICLGQQFFFFRKRFKTIYLPYTKIYRIFRRVQLIDMKMCCSKGQLQLQNIVLSTKKNEDLAMVDLPDEKAALAVIEEMQKRVPEIKVGMKKK